MEMTSGPVLSDEGKQMPTLGTTFEQYPIDILAPGSLQCKLLNCILLAGNNHRDSDESQEFSLLT